MQIYFLSVVYLLLGSCLLLTDDYGVRFPLLFSLRHAFRTVKAFSSGMVGGGFVLVVLLAVFPVAPGPLLLGDFLPMVTILCLTFWFLDILPDREKRRTGRGGDAFETNGLARRRTFGYATALVAVLHFLLPFLVLL